VDFETLDESTFMEMRNQQGEFFPIVASAAAPLSTRGRSIGHILLIRDRREVVLLQRQLAVSGRLAAVGDLSKSISASIHGPAVATRRQLERLASDWQAMANFCAARPEHDACRDAVAEGLELIAECIDGVDRVSAIIEEVGNFSAERERTDFACHRLSEIAETAVRVARAQAPENVRIEMRLDSEVRVLGNRSELERVVTNLVINAFHALDGTGRRVANLAVAVGAQGERALLHVEDDGCGIAPDSLERIFDPFFTTKPVGKGTGLGLAISYHIVRKHEGQIRVSSIQDRGTSVAVELPRFQEVDDRVSA
jgi:C4-dicarboxylate-specific signal transduction histidine kinase